MDFVLFLKEKGKVNVALYVCILFQLCPLEGVKAIFIGPAYVSSQVALARKDSLVRPVRKLKEKI